MTAQVEDRIILDKSNLSIIDISEPLNFNPAKYGITPEEICTACWRGFWCVYNITDKGIFLEDLYINSKNNYYPEIEGIKPLSQKGDPDRFLYMGHHLYKGLHIKIDYTGRILVGDEFLSEYYIHLGFQRPWAYKKLTELVFTNGQLVKIIDQSQIAADIREQIENDSDLHEKLKLTIFNTMTSAKDILPPDYKTNIWWLDEDQPDSPATFIPKDDFDDVKEGFLQIWEGNKHLFWYKKAWSILGAQGLTHYDTKAQKHEVYIRAMVLSIIYVEFCHLAFKTSIDYSCFDEMYEDKLDNVLISQMYSELKNAECTSDMNYTLCKLVNSKRGEVFSALKEKMHLTEIYWGMYYTAIDPEDVPMQTYKEYWDAISDFAENFSDKCDEAFDWLLDGTYALDLFCYSDTPNETDEESCIQGSLFDSDLCDSSLHIQQVKQATMEWENEGKTTEFHNDRSISLYKTDGVFVSAEQFTKDNLAGIHGMMVRCTMKNGELHEGFADSYGVYDKEKYTGWIHDFIYLWTWDNLDEETHQLVGNMDTKFQQTFIPVRIDDIQRIDAIMYSNPRWGGRLYNHFFIDNQKKE